METMQAAQVDEDLSLNMNEVERHSPGPGEALVKLYSAGVCATDLHVLEGMIQPYEYPMTVGHEGAGVVVEAGDRSTVSLGDRVAVYNKIFCGACEQCLVGRQNICDNEPGQFGFNLDGVYAEYITSPSRNLVPLPDNVDFATASVLACAGMTAVHAARLSNMSVGETAVVNGIGGVGSMVLQVAALAGARVLAIADTEDKLEMAKSYGASGGIVVPDAAGYDDVPERIRDLTGGRGTDLFFELVGTTRTMLAGIRSLAKHGRFVSTGYTGESLEVHPIEFILPETVWVSTVAATVLDLADAIRLAADGHISVPIAATYPLEGAAEALDNLVQRRVLGRQVLTLA